MEKNMFIRHSFGFNIEVQSIDEKEGDLLLNPILEKVERFAELFGAFVMKDKFWNSTESSVNGLDNICGYSIVIIRQGVLGELRGFADAVRAFCEFQNFPRPKERLELVTEVYAGAEKKK